MSLGDGSRAGFWNVAGFVVGISAALAIAWFLGPLLATLFDSYSEVVGAKWYLGPTSSLAFSLLVGVVVFSYVRVEAHKRGSAGPLDPDTADVWAIMAGWEKVGAVLAIVAFLALVVSRAGALPVINDLAAGLFHIY